MYLKALALSLSLRTVEMWDVVAAKCLSLITAISPLSCPNWYVWIMSHEIESRHSGSPFTTPIRQVCVTYVVTRMRG